MPSVLSVVNLTFFRMKPIFDEGDLPEAAIDAAAEFRDTVASLKFALDRPLWVYNPLGYAWSMHEAYLRLAAGGRKKVFFLGMNPGPWGMAQTGVPFGEVAAVRDWLALRAEIGRPEPEHPKRPVEGLACQRSEVSGRRLWGCFSESFANARAFFQDHFVGNYCPLVFMEESGRNLTPDKLPVSLTGPLFEACDRHLTRLVELLDPQWLVGIGGFAEARLQRVFSDSGRKIIRVLHPSPASPAANRGWSEAFVGRMREAGVWGFLD